jgi:hypothetical protein
MIALAQQGDSGGGGEGAPASGREADESGADAVSGTSIVLRGLLAGAAGVVAMTIAEKLEQALTKRPNSYVPGRVLLTSLGQRPGSDDQPLLANWAMHWGQGILLGAGRAFMARQGLRGPMGSFLFLNLRLANDQIFENATGVGAPPWTWPKGEQFVDLLHKGIYAFTTGIVVDRLVPARRDMAQVRAASAADGGSSG